MKNNECLFGVVFCWYDVDVEKSWERMDELEEILLSFARDGGREKHNAFQAHVPQNRRDFYKTFVVYPRNGRLYLLGTTDFGDYPFQTLHDLAQHFRCYYAVISCALEKGKVVWREHGNYPDDLAEDLVYLRGCLEDEAACETFVAALAANSIIDIDRVSRGHDFPIMSLHERARRDEIRAKARHN